MKKDNTQLTTTTTEAPKASALAVMATRLQIDPAKLHSTLKNTVFKNATDDELVALVLVANKYGLDPLTREMFAFPTKAGGIQPVVSVDGWIRLANDHEQCDGIQFQENHSENGKLESITCTIHRKDRKYPTVVTEYLNECKRNTEPWKMEHRMLRHKALKECARVAFGFSGLHDEDEASDIERNVTSRATVRDTTPAPLMDGLGGDDFVLEDAPLTLDERVKAKANELKMPVDALIVESAEAGLIPEKPLNELSDAEKEAMLA